MDDLVKMARAAFHDDRLATGQLYGDLADRIEAIEAENARLRNGVLRERGYWASAVIDILSERDSFRVMMRAAELREFDKLKGKPVADT